LRNSTRRTSTRRCITPPFFEAPNGLAEALSTEREKIFVSHCMRQHAYETTAPDEDALDELRKIGNDAMRKVVSEDIGDDGTGPVLNSTPPRGR
jgi:hypothetical protein